MFVVLLLLCRASGNLVVAGVGGLVVTDLAVLFGFGFWFCFVSADLLLRDYVVV